MAVEVPAINADKLNAFMGQLVGKPGATVNAALMVIGAVAVPEFFTVTASA